MGKCSVKITPLLVNFVLTCKASIVVLTAARAIRAVTTWCWPGAPSTMLIDGEWDYPWINSLTEENQYRYANS